MNRKWKYKPGFYDESRGYLKVTVRKVRTPEGKRWMVLVGNYGWICDNWQHAWNRALIEAYRS